MILTKIATAHSLINDFCVTMTTTDWRESLLSLNDKLSQLVEQLLVTLLAHFRQISFNESDAEIQGLARGVTMAARSLKKALKSSESSNEYIL